MHGHPVPQPSHFLFFASLALVHLFCHSLNDSDGAFLLLLLLFYFILLFILIFFLLHGHPVQQPSHFLFFASLALIHQLCLSLKDSDGSFLVLLLFCFYFIIYFLL